MEHDPELWQRRPLSSQLQQYAAADVSQLLSLAGILSTKLGEVGQATVLALSQTSSQLKLPIKPGTQVIRTLPSSEYASIWHAMPMARHAYGNAMLYRHVSEASSCK